MAQTLTDIVDKAIILHRIEDKWALDVVRGVLEYVVHSF